MNDIKLLKNFDKNDLIFKSLRKTSTGSRIIDIECKKMYQTNWMRILYDVEYRICVDAEKNKNILEEIDEIVIDYSSNVLKFSRQEILQMYRPLLNKFSNSFNMSLSTHTIMFDKDKNTYNKTEIKNILKQGQIVRFIFSFKKIYFKDHELTLPLELQQIECASNFKNNNL